MDFVTANLTPGRFFFNLQMQNISAKLQEIGYNLTREYNNFMLFKNSDSSVIKIRRDGSISCKLPVINSDEIFVQKLIKKLTLIIQTLNPVYSNLLDINNIFLYWPDNYNSSSITVTDYSMQHSNIYDSKYVSILNRTSNSVCNYNF